MSEESFVDRARKKLAEFEKPRRDRDPVELLNPKKKYKMKAIGFLAASALALGYAGYNIWNMHVFDKHVTKHVEIAANVVSISGPDPKELTMESSLKEAKKNVGVSSLENPAIIWKTPLTNVGDLEDLLNKAIERTRQIGQLQISFESDSVPEGAPAWVKNAHSRLDLDNILGDLTGDEKRVAGGFLPTLKELAESEYGQRIGSEYEALNLVVAGGTRTTGKALKEESKSLLDTLNKAAGFRSIIRLQAQDYLDTYAHAFLGYLKANMGYLDEGIEHFKKARKIMRKYPEDKNLSIIRDTPDLAQSTINGLLDSSIKELEALNKDPSKYSTGWWKRLRYYNQSIGGQIEPSIQDVSEAIYGRYHARMFWSGLLGLGLLFFAGRNVKKLRSAKKYEVRHETVEE